ncbi:GGDEF domain-containing protein [Aeoliella straminimaris]|nr:sensor domain-containing diguanylate cyclase [Aeoliella straminimaris]
MTGLLLVLNIVFSAIALIVGYALGIWTMTCRHRRQSSTGPEAPAVERQKNIERERTLMVTERLRDLAAVVANDVGQHSSKMGEITEGLKTLDTTDVEATGAGLVNALSKIVVANQALQERLARAEEQIAAQAREIHQHESEARTDSLTGLANRRAFDDELRRRCSEAERNGTALSLLIMDIDYFKKFNDTHGHQAGDEVLRSVGCKLKEVCREMDLPCRYGGEEFAVVMPATPVEDAKIGAERVRKAVESMTTRFEGKQLKVTTSIGVAQFVNADDTTRLVRRADDALYASKAAGRNSGYWHDGQQSHPIGVRQHMILPKCTKDRPAALTLESLPNRTKFADELRRRIAEAVRTEQPIAVLVAELDGYQAIRNRFDTDTAYAALDAVATLIRHSLREMDLVARLSESRFAVILPGNTLGTADAVVFRLANALKQSPLQYDNQLIDLELVTGKSELRMSDSVEMLVGRAEADLHEQFSGGAADPEESLTAG